MRTTRVRSKVERSHACAPLTKTSVWDSGFFAHALFMPKTPNAMGFSGSVNSKKKKNRFLDFGFCQCKWAYSHFLLFSYTLLPLFKRQQIYSPTALIKENPLSLNGPLNSHAIFVTQGNLSNYMSSFSVHSCLCTMLQILFFFPLFQPLIL